ncbi:AAA family ATPase [Methylobacterium oryzae]|uniref:AAA family ATPase n=1 Tax=Methylobacterium oryzae TaxID=334852 RepID=UPI002F3168A5
MHVISLVSNKGGSGKSTVSLCLAVAFQSRGFQTVVLDLDPQASSKEWHDAREVQYPHVESLHASRLPKAMEAVKDLGVEVVIIDTAPHTEATALEAVKLADLVIVPCQPSIMDIRGLAKTLQVLALVPGKPAYALMNGVQHHSIQAATEAAVTIANHLKLPVAPLALGERVAFSRCMITGQTPQEIEPDGKAAKEIDHLYQWVRTQLQIEEREAA